MGIHGALQSLEVKGRYFKVAHDGAGNKDIGGKNNELGMNGDGTFRVLQSVVPGQIGDKQLECEDGRGDQEYLQGLANDGLPQPIVATYADNTSYTGDLVITGELKKDNQTGLIPVTFQGSVLTKI